MALLAAGAAHELNNPLSVIVGYLSLILGGKTAPDRISEQLERVQVEAKHCRVVLEGLSELADFNRGEAKPLDVNFLLREAHDAAPQLSLRVGGEPKLSVRGREHGLLLMLRHLLRNARESGARSVAVTASRSSSLLRLQLQDDGAGLSASAKLRAKEPFFSTKPNGVGLGLTIAQLVVEGHGGSLELLTGPGGGTVAVVQLPHVASAGDLE
ncbi:MAG TPA: HAMP domain-containing sensor histidine kinase [Polyangiaceae bacterium]|nr:HAMP domain-containing sensor histidine kinase [Polyangiaceae bacterium]